MHKGKKVMLTIKRRKLLQMGEEKYQVLHVITQGKSEERDKWGGDKLVDVSTKFQRVVEHYKKATNTPDLSFVIFFLP